jgi:hypothetical protein
MELVLPPAAVSDWHLVLRLSLYPEWSKLHSYHYNLGKSHPSPSKELFTPRTLERPRTEWDAVQSLSFGVDLLSRRLWDSTADRPF